MATKYVAFFSYTHADDEHDHGLLSNVRARLESELRLTLGERKVAVFQDRDDLNPGDEWESRLTKALDESVFLVPVVTPSFFASEFCRREFMRFWDKTRGNPGMARIIPLYWRTHFPLEGVVPLGDDPVVQAVKALQFDDWREVRTLDITEKRMRQKIERLAQDLAVRYAHGQQQFAPANAAFVLRRSPTNSAEAQASRGSLTDHSDKDSDTSRQLLAIDRGDGRVLIQATFVNGPRGNWLLPGSGTTEWFQDDARGPVMAAVPAGMFFMGSLPGVGDGDEEPQHAVRINRPFAVGRFLVTFDDWDAAFVAGGVDHSLEDAGRGRGKRPALCSWYEAREYIKWLSNVTNKPYRLLSESEWEYCCRAGTKTEYFTGDTIERHQAQFSVTGNEDAARTVAVGSFPPNGWGIYDMHGNAWEWCEDNYHPDYRNAPIDGSVWTGGDPQYRVVRGGSWINEARLLRSALRNWERPKGAFRNIGFRVARNI